MASIHIYGIDYVLPKEPRKSDIFGFDLPLKKQKFYRLPPPEIFDELKFDEEGDPVYTHEQYAHIEQEFDRINNGYWFYNNVDGKSTPTYITGLHYFYLTYWTLEDGNNPEYRDADRRWMYFQDYCEKQPYIDGILRTKKRREGATSQATADLVRTAITRAKANCGIVSKTNGDAGKAFLQMIRPGYLGLPVFLKPRCEDEESKTNLYFVRSKTKKKNKNKGKGQVFDADLGLGSMIDFKPTQLNSYDSGRLTKALIDESGKFPVEVPINEYWPIVQQTLKQGAKRVGFALLPSTSNKLSKGGRGFKKLWDESNHFREKTTPTGLYRYFNPADDGFPPFIDEYGQSILGKPTPEQARWMKKHYEATDEICEMTPREYIQFRINLKSDEDSKKEEIRMYPLSEKDAFDYEDRQSMYNQEKINDQRERILERKPKIRKVRFYRKDDGTVDWVDDESGFWRILFFPEENEANAFVERGRTRVPANKWKYTLSADPFKNAIVSGKGSKGAGFIWKKFNPLDPENSGMPIAMYHGRPRLPKHFHKDMLLAAEYYGADICYESDLDTYIEVLEEEDRMGYAMEKPKSVIDPNKKKVNPNGVKAGQVQQKQYGVKSGNKFELAMMLERSISYVELSCDKIWFIECLDQLFDYEEEERTLFDLAAAFQVGTVAISDPVKPKKEQVLKKKPIIQTFDLSKNVR